MLLHYEIILIMVSSSSLFPDFLLSHSIDVKKLPKARSFLPSLYLLLFSCRFVPMYYYNHFPVTHEA